MIILTNIF